VPFNRPCAKKVPARRFNPISSENLTPGGVRAESGLVFIAVLRRLFQLARRLQYQLRPLGSTNQIKGAAQRFLVPRAAPLFFRR
jgi:hypothetical protein